MLRLMELFGAIRDLGGELLKPQESHVEAYGALWRDSEPPGMLQSAFRDPLGSIREALGELLRRSGSVLRCFKSPFKSILSESRAERSPFESILGESRAEKVRKRKSLFSLRNT